MITKKLVVPIDAQFHETGIGPNPWAHPHPAHVGVEVIIDVDVMIAYEFLVCQ